MAKNLVTKRQMVFQAAIAALKAGVSVKAIKSQLAEMGIFVTAQTRFGIISLLSHE